MLVPLILGLTRLDNCVVSVILGNVSLQLQVQHNYKKQDQLFHMVMHLPVALTAVSGAVQSILSQEFGRASTIIPNSVDCERFRPGCMSSHPYSAILSAPTPEVQFATAMLLSCPQGVFDIWVCSYGLAKTCLNKMRATLHLYQGLAGMRVVSSLLISSTLALLGSSCC